MWLASGTISAGNLTTFVSAGFWRFPNVNARVGSANLQSVTHSVQASTWYTYMVRSDGTFTVSGSTIDSVPGRPFWDNEYLGRVFVGSPANTANTTGPWNGMTVSGYEQRGEGVALSAAQPRAVYEERWSTAATGFGGVGSYPMNAASASGISFLTLQEPVGTYTKVSAAVNWMPSGAPAAGVTYFAPRFQIALGTGSVIATFGQSIITNTTLDPDSVGTAQKAPVQVAAEVVQQAIAGGGQAGYQLLVSPGDTPAGGGANHIRITGFTFVAQPGHRGASQVEPF